ncbi:hypothetical protein NCH01_13710 [Neoasaia chiangmaiensis]|uniref:YXWGXW repeat-containing protein n=1 Tax=Neoasaia chiangmaiensis TaxID=320497 RepID=UPI00118F03A2|nr:YXWGXW repeat-containing protein [Neoasaia chiangmaiensis]GEN14940.1 hypothetical protein NCH01_13710 [Neoasaia chiangmaiensis]
MSKFTKLCVLAALVSLPMASHHAQAQVVYGPPPGAVIVPRPPPPPMRYEMVPPPRRAMVWIRGHWDWRYRGYVWVPGHWRAIGRYR